jgi:hypothetical protein
MKTPVTLRVFKIKNSSTLNFIDFELHFQLVIDLDHWPGIYWLKLMVRDYKDDWWEEEKLFKKFWRSMTPEYQREEDDPTPF